MTDNIAVEPSGHSDRVDVATDEIGGVHYPVYKSAYGADGSITQVDGSNPMPVNLVDANGLSIIETYSKALTTIESEHARIHQGKAFQLSDKVTGLLATGSHYFLIDPTTPIHWRDYKFLTDGAPVDIELFENPTVTDNGTALTPLNRNRLSATVSAASIYSGPTVTDDGARIYIDGIVGTGDKKSTGSTEGIAGEWIVDGGNTYLLKLTNNGAVTISYIYQFFWYEL